METIILELYEIGAVKFGEFTLKSGINSPIYVDLRLIISYPDLLRRIAEQMWHKIKDLSFDRLCGVPYTALPIATALSLTHDLPMIMPRKEVKTYGTKRAVEGVFRKKERCLIIEDLITSGASILETLEKLTDVGLDVQDIVTLLDREGGGKPKLEGLGYAVHPLITLTEMLTTLLEAEKITQETVSSVLTFIEENRC